MASKIVLDGNTARCVYDDRFLPLLEALGVSSIQRASDVEFDNLSGEWVATHRFGVEIARGKNREEVIKQEVEWIEQQMSQREEG